MSTSHQEIKAMLHEKITALEISAGKDGDDGQRIFWWRVRDFFLTTKNTAENTLLRKECEDYIRTHQKNIPRLTDEDYAHLKSQDFKTLRDEVSEVERLAKEIQEDLMVALMGIVRDKIDWTLELLHKHQEETVRKSAEEEAKAEEERKRAEEQATEEAKCKVPAAKKRRTT